MKISFKKLALLPWCEIFHQNLSPGIVYHGLQFRVYSQSFGIPGFMDCGLWSFDLSAAALNCPIWHGKIVEKATFHSIGRNFHFLSAECQSLSTEFPFLEHRISISCVQNFHFLSREFWAVYLEQFLSAKLAFSERRISILLAWNLHFLRVKFPFSEWRILWGLYSVTEVLMYPVPGIRWGCHLFLVSLVIWLH